jgi:hypothetical protein
VDAADLVGTWRLVSREHWDADGRLSQPLGTHPAGYITYTPDGFVSVLMTSQERRPFSGGDVSTATRDELADAAATCLGYFGRFDVVDGRVRHHVHVSLYPNRPGQTLVRRAEIEGRRLVLSPEPGTAGDGSVRSRITWERVG